MLTRRRVDSAQAVLTQPAVLTRPDRVNTTPVSTRLVRVNTARRVKSTGVVLTRRRVNTTRRVNTARRVNSAEAC